MGLLGELQCIANTLQVTMSVLTGVVMMMAGVVTVSHHLDSGGPPGYQADQISREKRDGGVITAAVIGGVVTIASAAARAPTRSTGKFGGFEIADRDKMWCLSGEKILCCKRNRDENAHAWAGDWQSTSGIVFNCKVQYKDHEDYVCKGVLKCISSEEQNIAHEFKIGDYEGSWVRGLYKKKKGRDGRLIKDCTILMHGRYKRKAGIAYTGKITWAERISGTGPNDAEKWYKI